jgi:hypothetical protein
MFLFFFRYFQPFWLFFHTLFNTKVSQIDLNMSEKAGIEPRTVAAFSQTLKPLGLSLPYPELLLMFMSYFVPCLLEAGLYGPRGEYMACWS